MKAPFSFARMALSAVKAANLLMSLAITASLGILMIFSLNCSSPNGPEPGMDSRDSLAVGAILKANNLKWPADRSFIGVDRDKRVNRLNLYAMGIEVIPSDIGELDRLESLVLGNNRIKSMPKAVEALTALTFLDLSGNRLETLPDGFRLTRLNRIDLGRNLLTALPVNIDVTNLEFLFLDSNRIRTLPPDFRYLKALNTLRVDGNLLDSLPSDIGANESLRRLNAKGNAIRTVPASLMELPLLYLNLGDNRLCGLDSTGADPIPEAMQTWLDGMDRDWRESQRCP